MIAKSAGSLLLAAFVLLSPAVQAEEPGLFEQAINAFAEGDSPKSAGLFQKFLAMNPSPADARRLATGQHESILFSMLGDDACRDPAARLLSLASFANERVAADPETVRGVVRECLAFAAEDGSAAVWEAESRLARVGEGAAPILFEELVKTREQGRRARVAALVEKTGPAILLPWTECLAAADPDLRSLVLHLVGRMLSDNRCIDEPSRLYALSHVQALRDADNEPGPIREEAAEILKRHGAPVADSSGAVESFIRAGERFFLSEPARLAQTRVGRLSLPLSQVWMWDPRPEAQKLVPLDLASFAVGDSTPLPGFVPTFAVNEIMAQVSALHALRRDPSSSAAMALFACGVYAELSENRQIQESGKDYPEMSAFLPVLAAREATLSRETSRLAAMGCANLSGALRLALSHHKMGAAAHLIGLVADLGQGLPLPASESEYQAQKTSGLARLHRKPAGKEGDRRKRKNDDAKGQALSVDLSPLIDALDYPNPLIQYRAALALARFDPAKPFYRFDRVVPLLARAVGDITPQAVLVVSSDAGFANECADILQSLGYAAIRAVSPDEAIQKARDFPSKDAILIDHRMAGKAPPVRGGSSPVKNRKEVETAPEIFLHLQQDVRTKGVSTWILLPEGDEEPAAYGSAPVAGFLRRPVSRDALEEALTKTLSTSTEQETLARSTALAAAVTLGGLDRRRSIFAPALPEAARSLASAIRKGAGRRGETLSDSYRLPFLAALAQVGTSPEATVCLQAAEDSANSVDLRVAAIRTAGAILGNARPAPVSPDAVSALRRLLGATDDDDEARSAASWALGRLDLPAEDAGRLTLGAPPPEPAPAE